MMPCAYNIFSVIQRLCIIAGTTAICLCYSNSANSAQWAHRIDSSKLVIWMDGPIEGDDELELESIINGYKSGNFDNPIFLLVNSPGGIVGIANILARTILREDISVVVPSDSSCSSACFNMFAVSRYRMATSKSRIGVHSASTLSGKDAPLTTITIARMVGEFGVPDAVIGKMVRTPPEKISLLDDNNLHDMNVHFIDPSSDMYSFYSHPQLKSNQNSNIPSEQNSSIKCIVDVDGADYLNIRDHSHNIIGVLPNGTKVYFNPKDNINSSHSWVFVRFSQNVARGGNVYRQYLACNEPIPAPARIQPQYAPQPQHEPPSAAPSREAAPLAAPGAAVAPKPKSPAPKPAPAPIDDGPIDNGPIVSFKPRIAVPPR